MTDAAPETKRRWLNSTVLGVGLASLLADSGHEMATAAMPAFLATLGASSAALGLIEGVSDVYFKPVLLALRRNVPERPVWLVNAAAVKQVPGRKTDVNDSV